ncbi:NAD(P)-dependent oxidoreductase [Microbacterium sp. B19]|uniref:NAD(P)-dependent oxidoreductase n=1 Tax=Microbacterium sp. B19 TaxID=96765 RepID=UPI000346F3B4|nr:NAD(P)-dependent oxidoreductase [Microbacterium sp. B19]
MSSRAAERHAAHGVGYLAAPVFGRVPVAEAGQLSILAGGPDDLIDQVQPIFDVIGSRTWRLGDLPEQANAVKVLGNYMVACVIRSLGETVGVAERAGIDAAGVIDLLTATLFPGAVYASYGQLIAQRRYRPAGFTTSLGRKDLHLALDAADGLGVRLPFGEVLRTVFADAVAEGRGNDD